MQKLDRYWRVTATALGFTAFGLGTLIMSICLSVILPLMPTTSKFKRRFTRKIIQLNAVFYANLLQVLGLVRIHWPDSKTINTPGRLVIANHPMLLDAVFLMAVMPNVTFIVKSALVRNPFTFVLIHYAGYIPNSISGLELVEVVTQRIKAGELVTIFPEGTRSIGDGTIKFKRGAANIALHACCPILPVHIHCYPNILRKQDKWHCTPTPRPIYAISALPEIKPEQVIDQNAAPSLQARQLNRAMEQAIRDAMQAR